MVKFSFQDSQLHEFPLPSSIVYSQQKYVEKLFPQAGFAPNVHIK